MNFSHLSFVSSFCFMFIMLGFSFLMHLSVLFSMLFTFICMVTIPCNMSISFIRLFYLFIPSFLVSFLSLISIRIRVILIIFGIFFFILVLLQILIAIFISILSLMTFSCSLMILLLIFKMAILFFFINMIIPIIRIVPLWFHLTFIMTLLWFILLLLIVFL